MKWDSVPDRAIKEEVTLTRDGKSRNKSDRGTGCSLS